MTANQPKDKNLLAKLADESGLAVIVVDENSATVQESNNNSMCRALYSSEEFAPRCDEFCGKAFRLAQEAGKPVGYECHAGLSCLAVPLRTGGKPLAAIIGRAFIKASNYRDATERAIAGDWRKFPPTRFFENILLTGSEENLEKVAARLGKLAEETARKKEFGRQESETEKPPAVQSQAAPKAEHLPRVEQKLEQERETREPEIKAGDPPRETAPQNILQTAKNELPEQGRYQGSADEKQISQAAEEISAWRSLLGSLLKSSYRQACVSILNFLTRRYGLTSMLWLERRENRLEPILATGGIRKKQIQIGVSADDERLLEAARNDFALKLRERQTGDQAGEQETIYLFPIAVGGEVRSALAVGDKLDNETLRKKLARFCQTVASELEILRLREELSERDWLRNIVQKFNESLRRIDTDDFWLNLTQISAELLRAERASLLIYNEKSNVLQAKAAVGAPEDLTRKAQVGERIAQSVLRNGEPLVVGQIGKLGLETAPTARKYRTESFISYPIAIGERKIAVLNFTDRADRRRFGDFDLELLQAIAPQIAVAIDRAALKDKAGEFEQLSVTDTLTGLLNRRYLEERLTEEIIRSNREGYPMSFMMIDVDHFKSYNDRFGHTEGDKALKIVGHALKETLRGADVAARYGGEEFSILLPQTTCREAEMIAERVRQRVESTEFPHRKVTISIGVACCSPQFNTPDDLISAADSALYEAKRQGRNNVQVAVNLDL